jgi:protoheme IX farnesyltransferase
MLPVVAGLAATRRQILWYTLALVPVSLAPWALGAAGIAYAATAAAFGLAFVGFAVMTLRNAGETWARRTFAFSLFYLAALFAALLIERVAAAA